MHHMGVGKFVDRDRVAVAAAFRQRHRLGRRHGERLRHVLAPPASIRRRPAASNGCCSRPRNSSRRYRAVAVERRLQLRHHRRAERLPGVLLLAHPLHADRHAGQRARDQRRVGRGIVGAVMAVAAGAFDMDAANARRRHAQHFGDALRDRDRRLACGSRPSWRRRRIAPPRRTARSSRAPDRAAYRWPRWSFGRRPRDCFAAKMVMSCDGRPVRTRGRSSCFGRLRGLLPFRRSRQRGHRLDRLEFLVGDDGEEIAVANHLDDAGQFFDRRCVAVRQLRAIARRPHHARMHHAGQPHVLHIGRAAGDLGRDIDARYRLAHHLEGRRDPSASISAAPAHAACRRRPDRRSARRWPSGAITAPFSVRRFSAGRSRRRAASAISSSRTCAAAFWIAVPLSCMEWLPEV